MNNIFLNFCNVANIQNTETKVLTTYFVFTSCIHIQYATICDCLLVKRAHAQEIYRGLHVRICCNEIVLSL